MPNVEKITIALTPELSALVKESVDQGDYASTSEVIRDALRDWKHNRALQKQEIEELRQFWDAGVKCRRPLLWSHSRAALMEPPRGHPNGATLRREGARG